MAWSSKHGATCPTYNWKVAQSLHIGKNKVYKDPLLTYPLVSVPSILTLNPQDQCSGRGANGFIYGASCMEKETVQPPMTPSVHSQNVGDHPTNRNTLPECNSSPLKIGHPKRKWIIFQPLIFRGYVSFRKGRWSKVTRPYSVHGQPCWPWIPQDWCQLRSRNRTHQWHSSDNPAWFGRSSKMNAYNLQVYYRPV